jgi:large-conductance mechanosensitive channel
MKMPSSKKVNNFKLFFQGFKKGFLDFNLLITKIINFILLSITYFIGVGLTSIFAKMSNKHFLDTNCSKKNNTYWRDLDLKTRDIKEYYRQF